MTFLRYCSVDFLRQPQFAEFVKQKSMGLLSRLVVLPRPLFTVCRASVNYLWRWADGRLGHYNWYRIHGRDGNVRTVYRPRGKEMR